MATVNGSSLTGEHTATNDSGGSLKVIETGGSEIPWGYGEDQHYLNYRDIMEKHFGHGEGVVWDNTWLCHSYRSIYERYLTNMKIVHTHHGMLGWSIPPPFSVRWPRFLGLSRPHATLMQQTLGIPVRHVWNGVPLPSADQVVSKEQPGQYLLSLNRIMEEKGIHSSIDIARQHRIPIKVCGDDRFVTDHAYVHRIIQSCRDSNGLAEYYGLVDNDTKADLLRNCKAVIGCPQNTTKGMYMEAFGLFCIEALAYGKPVLCLANGGPLDIIEQGKQGFLASTPARLSEFVPQLDNIDPMECRKRAEQHFSAEKMADRYLEIFKGVDEADPAYQW